MLQEIMLLRAAVEASIRADRLDTRGEHFADGGKSMMAHVEAVEAADRAWADYDTLVWSRAN